jgi:hypothetical protein
LENLPLKNNKSTVILVFILLALFASQAISSMRIKSPTFDEPAHLISGYLAITKQYFHLGAEHPPLIKSLAALPLLSIGIPIPKDNTELSQENWFRFGGKFLFQPGNNVDQIIFLGRLPIVFLSALLGFYVFLWARNTYGEKSGLFALSLYVFSPNILAHSRLVTTDLGLTCFLFISCYYFRVYLMAPSTQNLLLAGVTFGLALTSKFSALILFPIFFSLLCFNYYLSRNSSPHDSLQSTWKIAKPKIALLKELCAFFSSVILVIFLVYELRPDALFLYKQGFETLQTLYFTTGIGKPPYLEPHFLLGSFFSEPIWYYPLIAFLFKTPVPALILLAIALGSLQRNIKPSINMLCLLIPVIFILMASFFDIAHQGLRRILPIYPFLFVIASRVIRDLEIFNPIKNIVFSSTLTILIVWYVISSFKIYPDYLTYFNDFVSKPQDGIFYLDDSNIDWGQDLKSLKRFMSQEGIKKIKLLYYGTADPKYYEIAALPLTQEDIDNGLHSGYYAISVHLLNRFKQLPSLAKLGVAWKIDHKPIKIIGSSIYVFKFGSP